jgi:hypothetical protein
MHCIFPQKLTFISSVKILFFSIKTGKKTRKFDLKLTPIKLFIKPILMVVYSRVILKIDKMSVYQRLGGVNPRMDIVEAFLAVPGAPRLPLYCPSGEVSIYGWDEIYPPEGVYD